MGVNGQVFAGMQHVIDNLNADTHEAMQQWPTFFPELKNVEALLTNDEKTNSLCVWTCLRHTQYAHHEKLFDHWPASLYEQRWGANYDKWLLIIE